MTDGQRVLGDDGKVSAAVDSVADNLSIRSVRSQPNLRVETEKFLRGRTFEELGREQGVAPIQDLSVFAGGWPDDEDLDEALADIYSQRA